MTTIDLLTRRAEFAPASIDEKARTATVVFSTGSPVERRDFEGTFMERLSLEAAHVKLDRLKGANVLDAHQQGALRSIIGVVLDAWIENGQGLAKIMFSERPEVEPIFGDVRKGVIRHVSVGYTVEKWRDTTDPATGARVRTAVDWTPHEISLVPVAADPGATVRSTQTMKSQTTQTPTPDSAATQNRAQIDGEIRGIATIAGLDTAFADGLIARAASADEARRAAFDVLATRAGPDNGYATPGPKREQPTTGVRGSGAVSEPVLQIVRNRRFGDTTLKHVLGRLASVAHDDGSQIKCFCGRARG